MEKTVYFLGSGFSKEAGGLVQNEIIKTILDEDFTRGNERLIKAKDNFIGFLKEELHITRIIIVTCSWKIFSRRLTVVSGMGFLSGGIVRGGWWNCGRSSTR